MVAVFTFLEAQSVFFLFFGNHGLCFLAEAGPVLLPFGEARKQIYAFCRNTRKTDLVLVDVQPMFLVEADSVLLAEANLYFHETTVLHVKAHICFFRSTVVLCKKEFSKT